MKTRNLILLVATLAALIIAVRWNKSTVGSGPSAPVKLVTFDVTSADRIETRSSSATVTISKAGTAWKIDSLWGYPARFETLAENVRKLAELEGRPVRDSETHLADFGLDPATNASEHLALCFVQGGKALGSVAIGSARAGDPARGRFPDGHYVRAERGPVLLADEFLGNFPRQAADWADRAVMSVPRLEIQSVKVTDASGASYDLTATTNGVFSLTGVATNETVKNEAIEAVVGALQSVTWSSLKDPKSPVAETGLGGQAAYSATLTNGINYKIQIGAVATQETGRIIAVQVTAPSGATNTIVETATRENARLAPWIFVIPDYAAANLIKPRADLVTLATNTPAAAPATPGS